MREYMYIYLTPQLSEDLGLFGTLKLFINCYFSKLKGFADRPQWSQASYLLKYRVGEVECGKLEVLNSVERPTKHCMAEIYFCFLVQLSFCLWKSCRTEVCEWHELIDFTSWSSSDKLVQILSLGTAVAWAEWMGTCTTVQQALLEYIFKVINDTFEKEEESSKCWNCSLVWEKIISEEINNASYFLKVLVSCNRWCMCVCWFDTFYRLNICVLCLILCVCIFLLF